MKNIIISLIVFYLAMTPGWSYGSEDVTINIGKDASIQLLREPLTGHTFVTALSKNELVTDVSVRLIYKHKADLTGASGPIELTLSHKVSGELFVGAWMMLDKAPVSFDSIVEVEVRLATNIAVRRMRVRETK